MRLPYIEGEQSGAVDALTRATDLYRYNYLLFMKSLVISKNLR